MDIDNLNRSATPKQKRENVEKQNKKAKLFSAKEFRKQIQTNQKLLAIQNFLNIIQDKNQDYIYDYLENGGNCFELLQILEIDASISPTIIFDIINHILLQISKKYSNYRAAATEACQYILSTYMLVINKMLGLSSSSQERRVVLKLLTTLVTFSASFAKDILLQINFHQNNLELLSKQTGEKNSVRDYFILFLTAYLVDGHFPTLAILLEKKGLLTSIVSGLKYDSADTVCIILTAMKNHILENVYVSKTTKMKTFNTLVVRDIVNLYNWKGPDAFTALNKKDKVVEVDEYSKSKVNECVHDFLLTLCTSHKYGVIFRDPEVGLSKKNQNSLMYTVLQSLERPWEHSYADQLVTKICGACPDLTKTMWMILKPFLELRPTKKWLNAARFCQRLIKELQPNCIEFCIKELSVHQLGQIMTMLVAPMPILKTLLPDKNTFEHHAIKQNVMLILLDMLKALESYLIVSKRLLETENYKKLKIFIDKYISRNFPDANTILVNWDKQEMLEDDFQLEFSYYINSIFDIFLLYRDMSPQLLDPLIFNSDLSVRNFLESLDIKVKNNPELNIKIIDIFFEFDQIQFAPKSDLFTFVLPMVLKFYFKTRSVGALNLIYKILLQTGIFENCHNEIYIWIDGFLNNKNFDDGVANMLVEIIRGTIDNHSNYLKILSDCQDTEIYFGNYEEILNILLNNCSFEGEYKYRLKLRHLSPLLVAFLEYLQVNESGRELRNYLQFVVLNLIHSQVSCTVFVKLVSLYEVLPENIVNYINNWGGNKSIELQKFKGQLKIFENFSRLLIHSEGKLQEFFEENSNVLECYPNLKLNLLQMCIFYLSNLMEFNEINETNFKNCSDFVKFFMTGNESFQSLFFSIVFENVLLLKHFCVLQEREAFCTKFLVDIVKRLNVNEIDQKPFLSVYRKKITESAFRILKKPHKFEKFTDFVELLTVFHLDLNQVLKILSYVDKLSTNYQIVSDIIVYSINRFSKISENPLDSDILTSLISYNTLYPSQDGFSAAIQNYFTLFPHQISLVTPKYFTSLMTAQDCKSNISLAVFLLKRNPELCKIVQTKFDLITENKAFLLQILTVLTLEDKTLLETVYNKLEPSILKALQKPQKAGQNFMQNYRGVLPLIEQFMSIEKCKIFFEKIQKFETVEIFHAKLLQVVASKLIQNCLTPKYSSNIVLIFMHLQMNLWKRKSDLPEIPEIFLETLKELKTKISDCDLKNITNNETFKTYCKFCLKFGVGGNATFLQILVQLIEILTNCFELDDVRMLFDMLLSHSEFLDRILNNNDNVKLAILSLMLTLCQNWKDLMERSHIPVLLAAYTAMVNQQDRIILTLLRMYESLANQTNFYDFKPFLWGKAATAHYSVRSTIENNLRRQPKMGDVLDILEETYVVNTINKYPLKHNLNPELDKDLVENACSERIYDIGFLLPLFKQLLASENQVQTYKFTRSGGLSLTIIALSSAEKEVRQAACYVLSRFYFHLEAKQTGKDTLLWLRFVEAVCKGTALLSDFKLNNFSAIYLAKMALILTQPNHVMYVPLAQHLSAKSLLNFSTVPELHTLLHSCDVNYKEHRIYILELLRDGLRTEKDFADFQRSMAYKLFSELYSSCISDTETKLLILDVIFGIFKTVQGVKVMFENHSILPQLYTFVTNLTTDQDSYLIVRKIIKILNCCVKHLDGENFIIFKILERILSASLFEGEYFDSALYETLFLVFEKDSKLFNTYHFDILLKKSPDEFCTYVHKYGCDFVDTTELTNVQNEKHYLRLLFYNKYKT